MENYKLIFSKNSHPEVKEVLPWKTQIKVLAPELLNVWHYLARILQLIHSILSVVFYMDDYQTGVF